MDVLAVGRDRRKLDAAEVVLDPTRFGHAARTTLHGLPIGLSRVGNGQSGVLHAVAVRAGEARDLAVAAQAARQDETDVALLQQIGGPVADTCLGSGVGRLRKAERSLVVVGGLLRVADVQLEVVPAVDRHEVGVLPHQEKA